MNIKDKIKNILEDETVPDELNKKPTENGYEYLNRIVDYYKNSKYKTQIYGEMLR